MRLRRNQGKKREPLVVLRPGLGTVFWCALSALGAVLLVESASWQTEQDAVILLCSCAALFILVAVRIVTMVRHRAMQQSKSALAAALFVFVCATLASSAYWVSWESGVAGFLQRANDGGIIVELTDDGGEREYGTVSKASFSQGVKKAHVRVLWPDGASPLTSGHLVWVTGTYSPPSDDEGGRWNHRNGFIGMLVANQVEDRGYAPSLRGLVTPSRDRLLEKIVLLEGDAAGLLAGVLLGNRTLYSGTELEHDFQTTGLAHLMAVSGTHLAVVTVMLGWVLQRLPVSRRVRLTMTAFFLVGYVSLTSFAPSAVRACVMCIAFQVGGAWGRRGHPVSTLGLCVLAMVTLEPPILFSLGFQLSALSVLGLILLSPLVEVWMRAMSRGRFERIVSVASATLSAWVVTCPLTVPLFAQAPLIAPFANLLAAPLITLVLGAGMASIPLVFIWGNVGCALLAVAGALANTTVFVVRALADVPGACLPLDSNATVIGVVCLIALVVLWVVWPLPMSLDEDGEGWRRPVRIAVLCACALTCASVILLDGLGGSAGVKSALFPQGQSGAQVVMLDVGQGDSTLIRDGSAAVLIDTGEDGTVLVKALARQGITRLDAVVLTHKDADHCGALGSLSGVVEVDHVLVHSDLLGSTAMSTVQHDAKEVTKGRGLEGMSVGDSVGIGRFSLKMIAPESGGESDNEDSLVQFLEYDDTSDGNADARMLFTGDAEAEVTEPLARSVGDIDILKVAHHGSRGGQTASELSVLKPEIALIGVGADNDYGHPTKETLGLLSAVHAKVYRTDLNGDISIGFSEGLLNVRVQREAVEG